MQAARPDSGDGRGGGGSWLHGAGADSGHAEGAEAGRPDDRSDRPGGAERGVRGAGDRLYPRAQARPGEGQHLRRRDRPRPPARRHGCEDFDDSRTRLTPYEVPLRFMRHVYRGRSRHLHARGARLMAAYDRVLVEIAGGVGTLTLNRPEKLDRKSTRLNSSHDQISYAVFCLKKKKTMTPVVPVVLACVTR